MAFIKVILINEKGAYMAHNGKTFYICMDNNGTPIINRSFAAINIDGTTVDTPMKNFVVIDAHEVAQKLADNAAWDSKWSGCWDGLRAWAKVHRVDFTEIVQTTFA